MRGGVFISLLRDFHGRVHGRGSRECERAPLARTSPPNTTGSATRDGEKIAALSKRRCSRVDDSRGTTLRERHSGVEHAAAPFSPRNCACVHPTVICMSGCACVHGFACARARLPPTARLYIRPFPHPRERESRHPFTPSPISRASPFSFFFSLIFFYFLFFLFFFLFLLPLFPRRPLSSSPLLRSSFFLLFPPAPGKIAAPVR